MRSALVLLAAVGLVAAHANDITATVTIPNLFSDIPSSVSFPSADPTSVVKSIISKINPSNIISSVISDISSNFVSETSTIVSVTTETTVTTSTETSDSTSTVGTDTSSEASGETSATGSAVPSTTSGGDSNAGAKPMIGAGLALAAAVLVL